MPEIIQLRQDPPTWNRETTPALLELTQTLLAEKYVATVERPTFGDTLSHGDTSNFGLGEAHVVVEIVVQLGGPHLDVLLQAAAKSFAEEIGKRTADGVLAIPGIIAACLVRHRRTRIRVETLTGDPVATLDAVLSRRRKPPVWPAAATHPMMRSGLRDIARSEALPGTAAALRDCVERAVASLGPIHSHALSGICDCVESRRGGIRVAVE
ncbi:hypothetical protein [Curtobacterium sp. PhB136]|uniref:hypothetical protein n=1 Tax=Curtobacterium sp. PhB136 TaxID=2485181 RepID=UPI001050A1C5|nr:hypothetical protein [Curtobacterium sp. PhB136]TCK65779.1 hypothetical protein EDF27_0520 [Curtobacterium sp. PhB136]